MTKWFPPSMFYIWKFYNNTNKWILVVIQSFGPKANPFTSYLTPMSQTQPNSFFSCFAWKFLILNSHIYKVTVKENSSMRNHQGCHLWWKLSFTNELVTKPGILSRVSLSSSLQHHTDLLSAPVGVCEGVGPVPGLEIAPKPLQVDWGEVSANAFPQPPLPLCCAAAAWLTEFVPEMFPPNPPGEEGRNQRGWNAILFSSKLPVVTGDAPQSPAAYLGAALPWKGLWSSSVRTVLSLDRRRPAMWITHSLCSYVCVWMWKYCTK